MKLSNIKGDSCIDVIADILEPIGNIATDEDSYKLFKKISPSEGENPKIAVVRHVTKNAPIVLKSHKEDIIAIIAAVSMKTVEEYKSTMTMMSLFNDFIELLTDDIAINLFTSAQNKEQEMSFGTVQVDSMGEA